MTKRKLVKSKNTAMAAALQQAGVTSAAGVTGLAATGVPHAGVVEGALHNIDVVNAQVITVISNPITYIDDLTKLNPFWGGVAMRTFVGTIGYYAVSATMWAYRTRNSVPKVTSDIDAFNGMIADIEQEEFNEVVTEMQGNRNVPFVDGESLVGAYKQLFLDIIRTARKGEMQSKGGKQYELPTIPHLYMRATDRDTNKQAINDAYEEFDMEHLRKSSIAKDVLARSDKMGQAEVEREVKKAQTELDHIHSVIRDTKCALMTDELWNSIPLWVRYKLTKSIYNQCVSANAEELKKPKQERDKLRDLIALGEIIKLELQGARKKEEVQLAFDKEFLKEAHELTA